MLSKIKIYPIIIFTALLVSCRNESEKRHVLSIASYLSDFSPDNNPDYKVYLNAESKDVFKFKEGSYSIYKSMDKTNCIIASTFNDIVSQNNEIDSSLPVKEIGEYDNIEIIFIDDNFVNLKNTSFTVISDINSNIKENLIIKCVIIEGSKSIFDNGGDIKLKCLNSEELDLSYSVLFKGVLSKSLQAYPEKAISNFKTIDFQLTCNKKEIIYEENTFYYGEFIIDPELKEILIDQ